MNLNKEKSTLQLLSSEHFRRSCIIVSARNKDSPLSKRIALDVLRVRHRNFNADQNLAIRGISWALSGIGSSSSISAANHVKRTNCKQISFSKTTLQSANLEEFLIYHNKPSYKQWDESTYYSLMVFALACGFDLMNLSWTIWTVPENKNERASNLRKLQVCISSLETKNQLQLASLNVRLGVPYPKLHLSHAQVFKHNFRWMSCHWKSEGLAFEAIAQCWN